MANRSHIYTCDEVPGGKGFYARGLSEYNWDIPIVHKLMVATNPRIVRSAIWEHDIGILADRAGAFERTIAFLEKVGEGDLADRTEFDEELAQMREFLASTLDSKHILLEAGEILDLIEGEDLGKLVADLHAEIPELAAKAERAIAGQEDAWLGELRAEWGEKARPGYWSDILYYSFEGAKDGEAEPAEAEADAPAKPAKAAKPANKSAKKAAKKPAKKTKTAVKKPAKKAAKKPAKKAAKKAAKKPAKKLAKKKAKKK